MKKNLILFLFLIIPMNIFAKDITNDTNISIDNQNITKVTDKNENSYITITKDKNINITAKENIHGIYIIYELSSKTGSISSNEKSIKIGENGYLHEYIDIYSHFKETKNILINYSEDVKIGEIYVIGEGEIPEFVEIWEKPLDNNTDLLLLSTHSDDEQLFFLGLLPTYVDRGANVQVVYFTNHYDNPKRLHEQLHGLYTVGIRNYPIIGIVPDAYSETLEWAINNLKRANLTVEALVSFQTNIIRRFKPSVIVGHDELGEYSHGQHILNTHTLKLALEKSNDKTYDNASYQKYGTWEVPKTYIHLYKENQIIMDYDIPLKSFGGLTAYEVSKKGYSKHYSQQYTWFTKWINGQNNEFTKSTDIKKYSPNEFGLYHSTVGNDINKNDMFENLTYRKEMIEQNKSEVDTNAKNSNSKIQKQVPYYFYIIGGIILLKILSPKKKKVKHK